MSDPIEKIIRPIVEGQIRGFLKEHPSIVGAVDWYKKRADKATTLTNSLSKRIVLDLICAQTKERLEEAFFEVWEQEKSGVEDAAAPDGGCVGTPTDEPPNSSVALSDCDESDQVGISADLVAIALRHEIEEGTYRPDHLEIARTV